MKIAIDGRVLTKNPTGVANFLLNAVNSMTLNLGNWEFYILLNRPMHKEIKNRLIKRDNINIIIKEENLLFKNIGILWYLFRVNNILKDIKPDYYWAPGLILPPILEKNIKTIVTVHDFVYKEHSKTMGFLNKIIHYLLGDLSINKANKLWTVSEYTKDKLLNYFPNRLNKEIFVGSSVDQKTFRNYEFSEEKKNEFISKHNLNKKFLLFVGTLEPRKNLEFLLSLMPKLHKQGYKLFVVGCKGWGETRIKEIMNSPNFPKKSVIFSGYLSTKDLVKAYNFASIYISASLNEGFGLPQLEAMSCGCPVVSSHNSAMIEVVEGAGVTVEGWNKKEWIKAIQKVYENRNFYKRRCLNRANEYDWQNIIERFKEFIYND